MSGDSKIPPGLGQGLHQLCGVRQGHGGGGGGRGGRPRAEGSPFRAALHWAKIQGLPNTPRPIMAISAPVYRRMLQMGEKETPAAAQIFGSDPVCMEEGAAIAREVSGADIIA